MSNLKSIKERLSEKPMGVAWVVKAVYLDVYLMLSGDFTFHIENARAMTEDEAKDYIANCGHPTLFKPAKVNLATFYEEDEEIEAEEPETEELRKDRLEQEQYDSYRERDFI